MNTDQYITSGILHRYIQEDVTAQERLEVECLRKIYPEIDHALSEYEAAFKDTAAAKSETPSAGLVNGSDKLNPQSDTSENRDQAKNISDLPQEVVQTQRKNYMVGVKIAATVVSALLIAVTIYLYMQLSAANKEMTGLRAENNALAGQLEILRQKLNYAEGRFNLVSNPQITRVILSPPEEGSELNAAVYWHKESKDVFIDVGNLPKPPTDMQYQLWAILDGKPKNIGVFEIISNTNTFQKLTSTENAEAFAVTLEERGGSDTANMDNILVYGQE